MYTSHFVDSRGFTVSISDTRIERRKKHHVHARPDRHRHQRGHHREQGVHHRHERQDQVRGGAPSLRRHGGGHHHEHERHAAPSGRRPGQQAADPRDHRQLQRQPLLLGDDDALSIPTHDNGRGMLSQVPRPSRAFYHLTYYRLLVYTIRLSLTF